MNIVPGRVVQANLQLRVRGVAGGTESDQLGTRGLAVTVARLLS